MSDNNCYGPPFSLNGILTIQQSQFYIYKKAWADFNRVQAFISYAERESFRIGQYLHQQQYPNSNWNSVQEN
jgi:hypothetical protein